MQHQSSTALAIACSALTFLSSSPAHAENLFLLQLGVFSNQENATTQFSNVDEQHNKILDGKHYILRKTRPISGGDSSWRVLVGPFENRRDASRTCSTIKDNGTDCFVVETAAINIDEFDDATQIAKDNPVIINEDSASNSEAKQAASSKAGGNSLLPWNWFSSNEGANNAGTKSQLAGDDNTDKKADRQAKVALATSENDGDEQQSSSNININTRSVYAAKPKFAPATTEGSLATAVADLFSFGDDDTPAETVEAVAPSEELPKAAIQKAEAKAAEVKAAEVKATEVKTAKVVEPTPIEIPTKTPEVKVDAAVKAAQSDVAPTQSILPTERTGDVEIAEAIPVPLLAPENVPVTPAPEAPRLLDIKLPKQEDLTAKQPISEAVVKSLTSEPAITTEITPQPIVPPAPQVLQQESRYAPPAAPAVSAPSNQYYSQRTNRLLQISIFDNDREAFACLNQIQSSIAGVGILRTRIIKSTVGKAVVRFGPVNDVQLEADICDAVPTCGTNLRCRILTEQRPNSAVSQAVKRSSSETKPKDLSPRRTASDAAITPSKAATTSLASKPVWIQLGTSSSKSDAEDRFESLKKRFPTLIGAHSPTITSPQSPSLGGEIHRLRIGPFDQRSEAQRLCAKLSSQGAGCLILTK